MADMAAARPSHPAHVFAGRLLEPLSMAGILAVAVWLRTSNLDAYSGSFDEGIRSQQLLLMAAGYRPFQDVFASQGPLLLDALFPFYLAFGQTLAAARAGIVVFSLAAVLGGWWYCRLAAGPVAGLTAAGILAISPSFLEGSRLALAEVPTIAPALLALGSLLAYRATQDRRLLAVSAACCALAALIKPMVVHVGVPIAVLLLAPDGWASSWRGTGWSVRRKLIDVSAYGLVVAAICAVVIAALGPAQVWDNLGAYRGGAGHNLGDDAASNLRLTANVMRGERIGLFALAAAGLVLGLWRRPAATLAVFGWAIAVLALFAVYGDLADKHIVYLTPAVALLGGIGAGLATEGIVAMRSGSRDRRSAIFTLLLGGVGVVAYLWSLPAVYAADRYLLRDAPRIAAERRGRWADAEIAETIRTRTPPDGWVLSDNPNAAFDARRKVIPYLVDTSGTRIDAGSLTSAVAADHVQRYQPSVIVTSPLRLGKLDAFVRRLPELGYRLEKSYDLGWKVYVREQTR